MSETVNINGVLHKRGTHGHIYIMVSGSWLRSSKDADIFERAIIAKGDKGDTFIYHTSGTKNVTGG